MKWAKILWLICRRAKMRQTREMITLVFFRGLSNLPTSELRGPFLILTKSVATRTMEEKATRTRTAGTSGSDNSKLCPVRKA